MLPKSGSVQSCFQLNLDSTFEDASKASVYIWTTRQFLAQDLDDASSPSPLFTPRCLHAFYTLSS
jgi:hypothetical protein